MKKLCWCALLLFLVSGIVRAADLAGHDHPLLQRYEGSVIVGYSQKEFGDYKLILGKALNPSAPSSGGKRVEQEQVVEGKITRITYFAPAGRSLLEVFRNYENEVKAKKGELLFAGSGPEELGYTFGMLPQFEGLDGQLFGYSNSSARYAAYKVGDSYVIIYAVEFENGLTKHPIEKGQVAVQVDIVESKSMQEKMVTIDAGEMEKQIAAQGKVALYGIYFDTNRTEIKPDSEAALVEIAKLLGQKPQLNVLVVGHTDSVGGFESNRTLSQRRADAIVTALVSKHGLSNKRLFAVGVAFAAPVATNSTEEGRARNRRVELVEMPSPK